MVSSTPRALKRMFVIAISMAILKVNLFVINRTKFSNGVMKIEKIMTVIILKKRLKCASFLESCLWLK